MPIDEIAFLLSRSQPQRALERAKDMLVGDSTNVELHNLAGICAATLGDYKQAAQFWRQAIALNPADARPYGNLGVMLASLGQSEDAEKCYRQALAIDPENSATHFNYAVLLANQKREGEAELSYRRAIDLDPNHMAAHANLGILLAGRESNDEAEQCYRKALAIDPADAGTYSNLGVWLTSRQRFDEGEQCYRRAIDIQPANANAHSNLGILLARLGRTDEAEQCYRQAIALAPDHTQAHNNLGLLLESLHRDNEAEKLYRHALTLHPTSDEIHVNLGNLLAKLLRPEEAEQCYRKAVAVNPRSAIAHSNLGVLLADYRRDAEAEQVFRQAIALDPSYARARHNLAPLLLAQGRFAEGWGHYESRYDPGMLDRGSIPPTLPLPQWRGEPLAGKSLLVWPEQGYGDEIQFCRYVPLLRQRGASRITLVCRPALKALLETLEEVDTVLVMDDVASSIPPHDYWTFPLSLPLHFGTDLAAIPAKLPYLHAPPERRGRWSPHLPDDGLKVGLVWKGNSGHANDVARSLPGLSTMAPLWAVPGIRFVSLQKGNGEDEARHPPAGQPLLHLGSDVRDFADSAAIVDQLDLVICVDTAVAHLAGALGKPCWVLLPAYRTDWRWLQERDDSPWYPNTLRLFRQQSRDDWGQVIADIRKALDALVTLN